MSEPILPLRQWPAGIQQASVPANDNALRVEALSRPALGVADNESTGPADGDVWIVGSAPEGAFANFDENDIALYHVGPTTGVGGWHAWSPVSGVRLVVDDVRMVFDGSEWIEDPAGGGSSVYSVNGQTGEVELGAEDVGAVAALVAGTGISIDDSDPQNPVITSTGGGSGTVESIVAGTGISVDDTDPANPIVSATGGGGGMSNPMTTSGDLIIGGASGTPTRLAAGTDTHVLTMVSGSPAWAAGGGGGGLTNWTEAVNSSSPNATVPVVSLTVSDPATNVDAALVAKGNGATTAQVPDGTSAGGGKRGIGATDWQKSRNTAERVASGGYSTISGGERNTASSQHSSVGGGYQNTASGSYSVVAGGDRNTASGTASVCGGGRQNLCTNSYTFIGSGNSNTASSNYAAIGGGQSNEASGTNSFIGGGESNTASGTHTWIPGGQGANTRGINGTGAYASGRFSTYGDAQVMRAVLRVATSSETPGVLTTSAGSASDNNQLVLPNNSAYAVKATVVVREAATGDTASWDVTACIKRGANAAATSLVGTPSVTAIGADAGAASWVLAVAADTTNGALQFHVTGEASHTLRWVADVYSCAQVAG